MTRATKTGLACLTAAVALALAAPRLFWVPLAAWCGLCLAAPFLHRWGFFLPIISRGNRRSAAVALTFDDGPDPATTPALLDLLREHAVCATFFITGRRAQAYPELVGAIVRQGHNVGNHSFSHDALAAFKGPAAVYREVAAAQQALADLGVEPLVFRPPVGITYPALERVLRQLNLAAVTFSCRALDRGNRRTGGIAARILGKVRSGDIVMLHDTAPPGGLKPNRFLVEVDEMIKGIRAAGLAILPLPDLIGRPVDRRLAGRSVQGPS